MPSFRSQTAINGQKAQLPGNSLRVEIKEEQNASFRAGGERVALCCCDYLSQQNEKNGFGHDVFIPPLRSVLCDRFYSGE